MNLESAHLEDTIKRDIVGFVKFLRENNEKLLSIKEEDFGNFFNIYPIIEEWLGEGYILTNTHNLIYDQISKIAEHEKHCSNLYREVYANTCINNSSSAAMIAEKALKEYKTKFDIKL